MACVALHLSFWTSRPCRGQPALFLLVGSALRPTLLVLVDLDGDVAASALCHMDGGGP